MFPRLPDCSELLTCSCTARKEHQAARSPWDKACREAEAGAVAGRDQRRALLRDRTAVVREICSYWQMHL